MRRPLILLIASATALVGLVILAVAFIGIGTRTLQHSQTGDSPCLQAYAADLPGSHIRYTVFPPRSICTFDVDGASTEVVVAAADSPGRRPRRRARPRRGGGLRRGAPGPAVARLPDPDVLAASGRGVVRLREFVPDACVPAHALGADSRARR